ncbi:MAG: DUF445 family protein, partial [Verrucomicrobiota bacterium]|nr:DUF445 family protein [Verrucomicrobiota bacterium]
MTETDPQLFKWTWCLLPVIAAIIGWGTNYLAVRMLFHPRQEKRILGLSFQGVFPKRQKVLAEKLGKLVARELFSMQDVKKHLQGDEFISHIKTTIETKVDEFLEEKLAEAIPMATMFLGSGMIDKVKQSL